MTPEPPSGKSATTAPRPSWASGSADTTPPQAGFGRFSSLTESLTQLAVTGLER